MISDQDEVEKKPIPTRTQCNLCGKYVLHIKFHMKSHYMLYIKCQKCNRKLRPNTYKQHISKGYCKKPRTTCHKGDKPYKCNQCNRQYNNSASLRYHIKVHSDDKEDYFECKWCLKRFPSKTLFISHVVTHTQHKNWTCEICDAKFSLQSSLRRHQLRRHINANKPTPNKTWLCKICNGKFVRKSNLIRHLEEIHRTDLHDKNIAYMGQKSPQRQIKPKIEKYTEEKEINVEEQADVTKTNMSACNMLHVLMKNSNPPFCCLCLNIITEEYPMQLEDEINLDVEDCYKNNITVIHMIETVLHRDDFVSTSVCTTCITSTISAYKFITMCEQATQKLNKVVDGITSAIDNHDKKKMKKCRRVFLATDTNSFQSTLFYDNQQKLPYDKRYSDFKCTLLRFKRISCAENLPTCDACGIRVKEKNTLIRHIKYYCSGAKGGTIPCDICGRSVAKNNLHRHKKACARDNTINVQEKHIGSNQRRKRTLCNICGKDVLHIGLHLKTHTWAYIECPKCGKKLRSDTYERHVRKRYCYKPRLTRPTEEKPYKCDQCGKRYLNEGSLRYHIKVHSENKDDYFECQWCKKRFPSEKQVISHAVTHTQEKSFACTICGEQFVAKSTLRRHHKRRHLNPEKQYTAPEKNWTCAGCGKKFVNKGSLLRHHEQQHLSSSKNLHIGKRKVQIITKNLDFPHLVKE